MGVGTFGADGELFFELELVIDGVEVIIPIHVGRNVPETAMGSAWLDIMKLVVNKQEDIFTLEIVEYP